MYEKQRRSPQKPNTPKTFLEKNSKLRAGKERGDIALS